jgi:acyl carrier protein
MNSLEDFITILRDDLGLDITVEDAGKDLDQIADWDSVHLIELLSLLERETGHPVALPGLLGASSLTEMYELAAREGN